jgi:nucleoside-diphosphate-sugar epimerase
MTMTLLIAGIHGFVGSNLVSFLKETHSIYGLDIISPQK